MKNLFGEEIIKEDSEEAVKAKEKSLFDYVNLLFKDPKKFSSLSNYEKGKNFFMMQRFFAIKQPLIAQAFNNIKVDGGQAVQCWCNMLSNIYNTTPDWLFKTLKSTKASKTSEVKKKNFSEEAIIEYCRRNMMSRRDYDTMEEFCPEVLNEEVSEIEKMLNYDFEKKKVK